MFKTISAVAATALVAFSVMLASADSAEARRHHGRGAAFVGGFALGILANEAIRSEARSCYRECHWVPGECWINNRGREVCRRGRRECVRYCD